MCLDLWSTSAWWSPIRSSCLLYTCNHSAGSNKRIVPLILLAGRCFDGRQNHSPFESAQACLSEDSVWELQISEQKIRVKQSSSVYCMCYELIRNWKQLAFLSHSPRIIGCTFVTWQLLLVMVHLYHNCGSMILICNCAAAAGVRGAVSCRLWLLGGTINTR